MTENKAKEWKLIVDKTPLKGSLNMAVDEHLLYSLEEDTQTYLRFYQWEKPTVSLGYSQNIEEVTDLDYCRENSIDIVRRITGGKLVLHHHEITYSVCSSDNTTFPPSLSESYRLISEALIQGLKKMGIDAYLASEAPASYAKGNMPCFSYPARNEIEVDGKKIVGSAQKRLGARFIQHGSIPVEDNGDLLELVSSLKGGEDKVRMTSLSQVLGREVSFEWAVKCLAEGFSEFFRIDQKPKKFSTKEKEKILRIQKNKYENKDWNFYRKEY
jgi:lipoate-protein ligase A